jgi:CheY-like chemotaxis protein
MKKELKYIMLIDDDDDDNYFHEKAIKKNNPENVVIIQNSGIKALEYLKSDNENAAPRPNLIFLDINMPRMNGWEFLNAYNSLDKEKQSEAIIIMLTTSQNLADRSRANSWSFVFDYISKPLTEGMMDDIIKKYFTPDGSMKPVSIIQ